MTVRDWAAEDQPRYKLMNNGAANLSTAELISLVIGTGSVNMNVMDLSRSILGSFNNSICELKEGLSLLLNKDSKVSLGQAKYCAVAAALELGVRMQKEKECKFDSLVSCAKDVFNILNSKLSFLDHEEVYAIFMSKNGKVLAERNLGSGSLDSCSFDIKKVLRFALETNCCNVALAHNHPHSTTRPSRDDLNVTLKIKEALMLIDVRLLDHIIISDGRYYSFSDNGEI